MPESSHARKMGVWKGMVGKKRCDGPFLLNEHDDLYFLLHKSIVHIILLNLEKKYKNLSEGKKDIAESVRKTVTPICKL